MFSQLVAGTPLVGFPVAGLLIFFLFTLGVYGWTYHPKRRKALNDMASMALDNECTGGTIEHSRRSAQ